MGLSFCFSSLEFCSDRVSRSARMAARFSISALCCFLASADSSSARLSFSSRAVCDSWNAADTFCTKIQCWRNRGPGRACQKRMPERRFLDPVCQEMQRSCRQQNEKCAFWYQKSSSSHLWQHANPGYQKHSSMDESCMTSSCAHHISTCSSLLICQLNHFLFEEECSNFRKRMLLGHLYSLILLEGL